MIAKQELQRLLNLPLSERVEIAQRLTEDILVESQSDSKGQATDAETAKSAASEWLLSMAGRYSGVTGGTAANADEIFSAEISRRSGFTTKPPIED